jgi:flagellar biosynthesis chaperone FliJ
MCKMCMQLFACEDETSKGISDRRIAAFRPCGHVFHYSCIMNRYEKMEDNCNCVTCYARFDDLPIVLFMEWSRSAKPISSEESAQIQSATLPGEEAAILHENVSMLKLKLEELQKQKDNIIRQLNETTENTNLARARCDGLDEICAMLRERITTSEQNMRKEERICDELEARMRRDHNQAIIGEICGMLADQQPESKLTDFVYAQLSKVADPDDLLMRFGSLYDHYHKQLKDGTKTLTQLRSAVSSMRKDVEDAENRLAAAQRAKQVTKTLAPKKTSNQAPIVDRKIVPTKPKTVQMQDDDDLGVTKRVKYNFLNLT